MSFFAGKLGNKSVVSLNLAHGDNAWDHEKPNGNTIFHSDMPFLFVEQRYRVNVYPESNKGYFVGQMPDELANLLSNDPDQVIVPVLVFVNYNGTEMRKQLMGRQETVGYNITVTGHTTNGVAAYGCQWGSTFPDLNVEWGTFRRGGLSDINAEIARQGTGGVMTRYGYGSSDYGPEAQYAASYGVAAVLGTNIPGFNRVTQRNWNPYSGWNSGGYTDIRKYYYEGINLVDPNWIAPLGPLGQGHNWVFVRNGGARMFRYSDVGVLDNINDYRFSYSEPAYYNPDGNGDEATYMSQFRGEFLHYLDRGLMNFGTEFSYAINPVAIEFLKLNLRTRGRTGGYYVTNPFVGNEIIISRDKFTVKGHDMRNTNLEMLVSLTGEGNDRIGYSNNWISTNNMLTNMGDIGDGGSLNLCGARTSDGVTETYLPVQGGSGAGYPANVKLGFYRFPANSSVEIDTRSTALKLNGQDIWSPTHRPLFLWNGQSVNDVIIGHNYELIPCAEGQEILLGEWNLGLSPNNTSMVLMSMEYMSLGLHITGDRQFMAGAGLRWEGCGRRVTDTGYNRGDAFNHMFVTLPGNIYIPIHARHTWSFFDADNSSEGKPRANIVYYLRKRADNGNLQFWVRSWSKIGWINVPQYRINIQKVA